MWDGLPVAPQQFTCSSRVRICCDPNNINMLAAVCTGRARVQICEDNATGGRANLLPAEMNYERVASACTFESVFHSVLAVAWLWRNIRSALVHTCAHIQPARLAASPPPCDERALKFPASMHTRERSGVILRWVDGSGTKSIGLNNNCEHEPTNIKANN